MLTIKRKEISCGNEIHPYFDLVSWNEERTINKGFPNAIRIYDGSRERIMQSITSLFKQLVGSMKLYNLIEFITRL